MMGTELLRPHIKEIADITIRETSVRGFIKSGQTTENAQTFRHQWLTTIVFLYGAKTLIRYIHT